MRNVRRRNKFTRNLVIGCNIGKLTTTPPKNIVKEYLRVFRNMYQYVDFFVVNLSCNTAAKQFVPRTREEILSLIEPMFEFRRGQLDYRPILVKISPDMTQEELDMVVSILIETPLDGIEAVSGSTALANEERGAVCGAMLTERALEVVRYVAQRSEYNYPIIGSGGMMTPEDIERMFEAGASLVALSSGVRENGLKLLRRTTKRIASKNLTTRR
jgi:dihydroorotate dehydrogenase